MTLLGTFLSQVLDGKSLGENLTPANMFAVLSILGARTTFPYLPMEPNPPLVGKRLTTRQ